MVERRERRDDEVERMVARGDLLEAARVAEERGLLARAAALYDLVLRPDDALRCALGASDLALAYAIASRSGRAAAVDEVLAHATSVAIARELADLARKRGRPFDAARFAEQAGDLALAETLFEEAGELVRAAALAKGRGDAKRAGKLLEARLREAPDDHDAALELAAILVEVNLATTAVPRLQALVVASTAARDPAALRRVARARGLLLRAFELLGHREAARVVLADARRVDPSLPDDVAAATELLVGQKLEVRAVDPSLLVGRYRVLETLGEGGTGRVLRAEDTARGGMVAIKVLRVSGGHGGRDALARVVREAELLRTIEHPHVVRALDVVRDGPLFVMEFMAGGTLEARLEAGALSPLVVRDIARSIVRALEAVHRRGVVHRDLKPANVFFGAAGDVKVGDFGAAHLRELGVTQTGAMIGTLAYMAPEQFGASELPTPSTDFYALGVLLFRALTGSLPFAGPDFAAQHLGDEVPRASERAAWLDPRFDDLFERLLAKRSDDRFPSASQVESALEGLPFVESAERFDRRAVEPTPTPRRPSSMPPAPSSLRHRPIEAPLPWADAAAFEDQLLPRRVARVPLDVADLPWARRLATSRARELQLVVAIDESPPAMWLALPDGEPVTTLDVMTIHALDRALSAVEALGLSHGALAPEFVRRDASGVTLLLPEPPSKAPAPTDDRDALARWARAGGRS